MVKLEDCTDSGGSPNGEAGVSSSVGAGSSGLIPCAVPFVVKKVKLEDCTDAGGSPNVEARVNSSIGAVSSGLLPCSVPVVVKEESFPSSSSSHFKSYLVGMGFSSVLVDKVIEENGEDDVNVLLEALLAQSLPVSIRFIWNQVQLQYLYLNILVLIKKKTVHLLILYWMIMRISSHEMMMQRHMLMWKRNLIY